MGTPPFLSLWFFCKFSTKFQSFLKNKNFKNIKGPFKNDAIVGKGGHTPFLEIQDVPAFYRHIQKTKVLNDSFNQSAYNFYPQGILILDKYLQKWWNASLI